MRCCNIDWLEVFASEDPQRYPVDADYFIAKGYAVEQREYGTRVFSQMFTVLDGHGYRFLEIRRAPQSGDSSFTGLNQYSCHLRLTNRACYSNTAVRDLAEFMIIHGYTLERIFRLDVCYDFIKFDSGDDPAAFIRRYIERKFSKINQCKVRAIGNESWAHFDWESVSWGSVTSMVSTKMYNKTRELSATGNKKPWIIQAWFDSELISNPLDLPDVWRIEFSLKSTIRNWIVIEDTDRKKKKKHAVPHTLEMFDGRDKIWQRFEELAYHYFRFHHVEYTAEVDSDGRPMLKSKYDCRPKILFKFNMDRTFYQIDTIAREYKPDRKDQVLKRHLMMYRAKTFDEDIRTAIDIIVNNLNRTQISAITPHGTAPEIEAIRLAIKTRTGWDYQRVVEVAEEIRELINKNEIW